MEHHPGLSATPAPVRRSTDVFGQHMHEPRRAQSSYGQAVPLHSLVVQHRMQRHSAGGQPPHMDLAHKRDSQTGHENGWALEVQSRPLPGDTG